MGASCEKKMLNLLPKQYVITPVILDNDGLLPSWGRVTRVHDWILPLIVKRASVQLPTINSLLLQSVMAVFFNNLIFPYVLPLSPNIPLLYPTGSPSLYPSQYYALPCSARGAYVLTSILSQIPLGTVITTTGLPLT